MTKQVNLSSNMGIGKWVFQRSFSSKLSSAARIYVFPITRDRSYVYFKYDDKLLNMDSTVVRLEAKLSTFSLKVWNKLRESPKSYNKKIVSGVEKLLEQINWTEDSLRSIPSKSSILKQVSHELDRDEKSTHEDPTNNNTLPEIPVLFPNSIVSKVQLIEELLDCSKKGQAYHKKQALLNLMGLPLTIPFIILPAIPNIPGFYLCYRLYCNLKALSGAKHLYHIALGHAFSFQESDKLNKIYESVITKPSTDVLINDEIIARVVSTLNLPEIQGHLEKALKQELKRRIPGN